LDPTFGTGGVVTTNGLGDLNDTLQDVAVLPDGKILAAGRMSSASTARDFALVRYDANGSLDLTFGGGDGIVTTDIGGNGSGDAINAIHVQGDGKIVAAGFTFPFPEASNDEDTAIVRYNADGTLDESFDGPSGTGNGIVTLPVSATDDDSGFDVTVDGSDRIVIAGFVFKSGTDDEDFSVIRLTSTGALDTAFDGPSGTGDGIVILDFSGANGFDGATSVGLLDGDIIAAGFAHASDSDPDGFGLARLNGADGTLDADFDGESGSGNGMVTTNTSVSLNAATIGSGKILGIGGGSAGFQLVRYNGDGTLDDGFGSDGMVTTSFGAEFSNGTASAVVPDGSSYAVAGQVIENDGDEHVALARYLEDGDLDPTFGGDGLLTTNRQPPAGGEDAQAVAVLDDANPLTENNVLAGGHTTPGDSDERDFALYRYRPDITAPQSDISKPGHRKAYRPGKIRTLRGTAAEAGSGVEFVQVALRRKRTNGSCAWWEGDSFIPGGCAATSFVAATGAESWSYTLPSNLKSSIGTKIKNYTFYSRASDLAGNQESASSFDKGRNANTFDVR
jgi:uncharacterized delta-60 repeat protein